MLDSLPIGVYLPGESPLHRLRARTKLLLLVWLALLTFLANRRPFHFGVYLVLCGLLALGLALAGIGPRYLWRRLRLLLILLALGVPFSLMWTPGATWRTFGPLAPQLGGLRLSLGPIVVTYDGIWLVVSYGAIFLLLYVSAILLTLTTTPTALAEGVVLLLRPLRRLGLPADEFGLMTLVALRFIPLLAEEAQQLVRAQMSRGADFASGSLAARGRAAGTLLVPLLQGALRRAEGLASALDARGYADAGGATPLHEGRLRALDWALLIGVPLVSALIFWRL